MILNMRVSIVSVMPSPYQRDVFAELAKDKSLDLFVYYQQEGASDSPWSRSVLESWESILPGWGVELSSRVRFQFNQFPIRLKGSDVVIVNCSLTSPSAQSLMRWGLRSRRWIFWGEKLRISRRLMMRNAKRILSGCLRRANAIAAVGEQATRSYRELFPNVEVANIPYGCDLTSFSASDDEKEGLNILFCGQMVARKGVDVLLKAFDSLVKKGSTAKLLLVGREGELPAWLGGLTTETRERIEWQGFVQPAELPDYFRKSSIFVLPSRYDGWGVVVNQALGAGLPVICSSAAGCAGELVVEGRNGFVVEPEDANALENRLDILLKDASLRSAFSSASRAMASSAGATETARRWRELLRSVVP